MTPVLGDSSVSCRVNVDRAVEAAAQGNKFDATDEAVETLVEAAVRGDRGAFARLYDRYADRVYHYVLYRLGHEADAEDVTQQVFLQAWGAIQRYQRRGVPFLTWLFAIAHNAVVSHVRRTRSCDPFEVEPATAQRWANPEAETLARYDRLAVRRAILRLKPEQQQVILMRFIENVDNTTIAAALGKAEGNVRVIQHRALLELRRVLAHEVMVR